MHSSLCVFSVDTPSWTNWSSQGFDRNSITTATIELLRNDIAAPQMLSGDLLLLISPLVLADTAASRTLSGDLLLLPSHYIGIHSRKSDIGIRSNESYIAIHRKGFYIRIHS